MHDEYLPPQVSDSRPEPPDRERAARCAPSQRSLVIASLLLCPEPADDDDGR
jgi:hypothetical protein